MSEQDRSFVERSGLTPAKIAKILGKSRQAVGKGIGGEQDYFSSSDLLRVAGDAPRLFPEASTAVQRTVADIFQELIEQVGSYTHAERGIGPALAEAERVWLICPEYLTSYAEQPNAYVSLFAAIDARRPDSEGKPLEVIVFCSKGRSAIEMQFDESWREQRQLAVVTCATVDTMTLPMVVLDPHFDDKATCYALAASGFEPLAPKLARSRVVEFAGHVSEQLRATGGGRRRATVNVLTAPPQLFLETGQLERA